MNKYKIKLIDIPTENKYQGYLWRSNAQSPEVFHGETIPQWPNEFENPFIIEGNLYDKHNNLSYLIKFIEGKYQVYRFDLKLLDNSHIIKKEYLMNPAFSIKGKLCFREYWIPEKDENCEYMKVLKPAMTAFVGFKNMED